MNTQIIYHPDIFLHDAAANHVQMESDRIARVAKAVLAVPGVAPVLAQPATARQVCRNHDPEFIKHLLTVSPEPGQPPHMIDRETILNEHTLRAMVLSAGAACQGVDAVMDGRALNAFCPVYAGHHAEASHAAGFCFINSVAIAAKHALARGAQRVAILDIDTHSGNGTVMSFIHEKPAPGEAPRVLFAETYQEGYPHSFLPGYCPDHILRRRVKAPYQFHHSWTELLEKVAAYDPELVIVSAGFDAHMADPLGQIRLLDDNYQRIAREILAVCPRVVACLEGGYDVDATARCAAYFVWEMVRVGPQAALLSL